MGGAINRTYLYYQASLRDWVSNSNVSELNCEASLYDRLCGNKPHEGRPTGLPYSNGLFVKSIDYVLFSNIACAGAKFSWNFTRKRQITSRT